MCFIAAKQRPGELVNDNQVSWYKSGIRLFTDGPGSLSFVLLSLISSPWVLLYISVGSKHRLINSQLCILWFNLQAIQLNKLLKLCFLCNHAPKGDFIIYVFSLNLGWDALQESKGCFLAAHIPQYMLHAGCDIASLPHLPDRLVPFLYVGGGKNNSLILTKPLLVHYGLDSHICN